MTIPTYPQLTIDHYIDQNTNKSGDFVSKTEQNCSLGAKFYNWYIKVKKTVVAFCNKIASFFKISIFENTLENLNTQLKLIKNTINKPRDIYIISFNKEESGYIARILKPLDLLSAIETLPCRKNIKKHINNLIYNNVINSKKVTEATEFFSENASKIVNDPILKQCFQSEVSLIINEKKRQDKLDINDFYYLEYKMLFPVVLEAFIEEKQIEKVCNYFKNMQDLDVIGTWKNISTLKTIFNAIDTKSTNNQHIEQIKILFDQAMHNPKRMTIATFYLLRSGIINETCLANLTAENISTFLGCVIKHYHHQGDITFEDFQYALTLFKDFLGHSYKDEALEKAIRYSRQECLYLLTKDGFDPNPPRIDLLDLAMHYDNFSFFEKLRNAGAKLHLLIKDAQPILVYAIKLGRHNFIPELIEMIEDLDAQGPDCINALMAVCNIKIDRSSKMDPNIDIIKKLVEKGVNLNLQEDLCGNTALTYAVLNGNLEAVKRLVKHGADIQIQGKRNETALMIAKRLGYEDIEKVLSIENS